LATSTSAKVRIRIEIEETKTTDMAGTVQMRHVFDVSPSGPGTVDYADGNAASQVDLVYSDSFSVASGTPITYDLAGSLTSILDGSAVTFTKIRGIAIVQRTGAGILAIGAGSNPLLGWVIATGDGVNIGTLGYAIICDPTNSYTVTAGTGDVLTLTSSTGTITGDLLIWGY
jgi:hypothetical protein